MQLGKAVLGAVVGGAIGIGLLLVLYLTAGLDQVWLAIPFAIITGLGVRCVFAEPQFEPRIVRTVIEGTPARAGFLDPLGAAVPAGPGAYAAVMNGIADSLLACLGG